MQPSAVKQASSSKKAYVVEENIDSNYSVKSEMQASISIKLDTSYQKSGPLENG
jgi:hypothetical protein